MLCPYCRSENQPGAVKCAACTSWMVEPPPVREWVRPRDGRMIAGVCRGFAARFGLPVAALRLAFLLTFLVGAMGLLVYLACWIAMPSAPFPVPLQAPLAAAPSAGAGQGGAQAS